MIAPRIDVSAGTLQFGQRCYRATRDNTLLEPVPLVSGEVRINLNDTIKGELTAELSEPTAFRAYRDYLAPFVTLAWRDPATGAWQSIDEQVGLYLVIPPNRQHTAIHSTRQLHGYDLLWLLASQTFPDGYVLPQGMPYGAAVENILVGAGIGRYLVPDPGKLAPSEQTWKPGTSKLEVANALLTACGFYALTADRWGVLTTGPYRSLAGTEPSRLISSRLADIGGEIQEEPVLDSFCNDVTVVCTDPAREPFQVHRRNADPLSPTSTVSLQDDNGHPLIIARTVEDPTLVDEAAAVAMAERILEESTSVYTRLTLNVTPDPRFAAHEVLQLDIQRDDGTVVADGRWWWDELRFGFTPDQGQATYRTNKLVPFQMVA